MSGGTSRRPLPFVDHVGVRIDEAGNGRSLLCLPLQGLHANGNGVVHGGAMFTLADTGMGCALHTLLEPGQACATIEVKIQYFRPVRQGSLQCRSEVLHRGRSVAHLESHLHVDGVLVAKATGSFAILAARPPAPG